MTLGRLLLAALAAPVLLGGALAVDEGLLERWPAAGAWLLPVGDPYALGAPSDPASPFRQSRGVTRRGGRVTHQGADLLNGRAGDTVRAAANGLVIKASRGENDGYGQHLVLAHRGRGGDLHYSVYAHLLAGSMRVEVGDVVAAAQPIARVGRTGRATTPHLHFEVREGRDPAQPWELAPVLEPLEFVAERLPTLREDGHWAKSYLEWGERAALLPAGAHTGDAVSRERWWRMLAQAAVSPLQGGHDDAHRLRDTLIALGVLPEDEAGGAPAQAVRWSELARDVRRLRDIGVRLPRAPQPRDSLRAACETRLGCERPSRRPRDIARLEDPPTVGLVCLVFADLAEDSQASFGEAEEAPAPPRRKAPKRRRR